MLSPINPELYIWPYPGYIFRSKIEPMSVLVLPAVVGFIFDGVNGQPVPMGIQLGL